MSIDWTLPVTVIGAAITIGYAAVTCFKVKYSDAKHNQNLQARLEKIEEVLARVEAGKIEELETEIKVLKNIHNLTSRAKR